MNRRLERVNVASLRVALISTGVVAVVYAWLPCWSWYS